MVCFEKRYAFISRLALIKSQFIWRFLFAEFGKHSRIIRPLRIANSKYMRIGNNVYIDQFAYLVVDFENKGKPRFVIEDNVKLGNFNHITCVNELVIENNVLTADRVYISDNYHVYNDISRPIRSQGIASKRGVYIGADTWIGDNVSIISCRVGRHCVIGANSVVTHDIPDYSIAVGSPAHVIKKYNFDSKKWETVNR